MYHLLKVNRFCYMIMCTYFGFKTCQKLFEKIEAHNLFK